MYGSIFHSPTLRKPYTSPICAYVNPSVDTIKRSLFRIYSGSVKDSYPQVSVNNTNHRRNNEKGYEARVSFFSSLGPVGLLPGKAYFFCQGPVVFI
jgi:hypothetical protein